MIPFSKIVAIIHTTQLLERVQPGDIVGLPPGSESFKCVPVMMLMCIREGETVEELFERGKKYFTSTTDRIELRTFIS